MRMTEFQHQLLLTTLWDVGVDLDVLLMDGMSDGQKKRPEFRMKDSAHHVYISVQKQETVKQTKIWFHTCI